MAVNDGLASLQTYSSEVSGAQVSYTVGSIVTLRTTNVIGVGSVSDVDGRIRSVGVGSPISYGAFVQAGQVGPIANGSGIITFGRSFSNTSYAITLTALGSLAILPYVFSGTAVFTTSGCVFGGQSGTNAIYGYVAVGL